MRALAINTLCEEGKSAFGLNVIPTHGVQQYCNQIGKWNQKETTKEVKSGLCESRAR